MERILPGIAAVLMVVAGCTSVTLSPPASSPYPPARSVPPTQAASIEASPDASSSASTPPSPVAFTSPFYGYTVTLPGGWTATAATAKWDGNGAPGHDDPQVDRFGGAPSATIFSFAAPTDEVLAAYAKDIIQRNATFHGDTCPPAPEVTEPIKVGTDPGTFIGFDCGLLINIAVVVHDGIGHEFVMRDLSVHAATDANDRSLLNEVLAMVRFPC